MATKQTTKQDQSAARKLTRAQAANQVIAAVKGRTTLGELAAEADALVVAAGGTSKLPASKHHVRRALETAEAMGVLRLTKPSDVLVERTK